MTFTDLNKLFLKRMDYHTTTRISQLLLRNKSYALFITNYEYEKS